MGHSYQEKTSGVWSVNVWSHLPLLSEFAWFTFQWESMHLGIPCQCFCYDLSHRNSLRWAQESCFIWKSSWGKILSSQIPILLIFNVRADPAVNLNVRGIRCHSLPVILMTKLLVILLDIANRYFLLYHFNVLSILNTLVCSTSSFIVLLDHVAPPLFLHCSSVFYLYFHSINASSYELMN